MNYIETKVIQFEVHEISTSDAEELVNFSLELLKKLDELNLTKQELIDIVNQMNSSLESYGYELINEKGKYIEAQVSDAVDSYNIINELSDRIETAKEKGIDVSDSERLLKLAKLSLGRLDFSEAYSRAKDAQVTYALETKGEWGTVGYYVSEYPIEIIVGMFAFILFVYGASSLTRLQLLKRRLRKLKEEEKILQELIAVVQTEVFKNNRMSMEEYQTAMEQYTKKLTGVLEETVSIENKISHQFKFTGKVKSLKIEREKLLEMIKQLQTDYLKLGKIETRAYQIRLESYNSRLSEIDEKLATMEVQKELKEERGRK